MRLLVLLKDLQLYYHPLIAFVLWTDYDVGLLEILKFQRGGIGPSFRQKELVIYGSESNQSLFFFMIPIPVNHLSDFDDYLKISIKLLKRERP